MRSTRSWLGILYVSLLVALPPLVAAPRATAQDAPEPGVEEAGVEEIIVTGRKREETLQETPLSIRAFSSAELEARTLSRLDEIGLSTANMLFDATDGSSYSSRIYVRGVGQDSAGRLVDPGVGLYVDGVYIPRALGGLLSLIDPERIEVLRGPQGTLYGKNTIGGVVHFISQKPGPELGGRASIRAGNYATLETKGSIDVPLGERLFTRLALATATDDGWARNQIPGVKRETGDNKLLGGRFSLRALPTESLTVDWSFDQSRENETQRVRHCLPGDPVNLARFLGDNLFDLGERCATASKLDEDEGFAFPPSDFYMDQYGTNLTLGWSVSDEVELKSISSWRHRDFQSEKSETSGIDPGVTPSSVLNLLDPKSMTQGVVIPNGGLDQEHDAWSQELQLNGLFLDGRLRLVSGLYWSREKGHTDNVAALPRFYFPGAPLDLRPPGCCSFFNPGAPRDDAVAVALDMQRQLKTADLFFVLAGAAAAEDPLAAIFSLGTDPKGDFIAAVEDLTFTAFTEFENTSYAGYVNAEYEISEGLLLEAGLRRTQERKESQADEVNFFSGRSDFGDRQSKRFDSWTPMAKLSYRFSDDALGYLAWARGWKSGGFNSTRAIVPNAISAQQTPAEARLSEFDPETADTWELGFKTSWLDNRLVVNLAGFYNTYKDIQLTITQTDERGLAATQIRNAARAKIFGAELEATARPVEGLTLTLGVGHTHAEYEDFDAAVADPIDVDCANLLNSGVFGVRRPGVAPIPPEEGFVRLPGLPLPPIPVGFIGFFEAVLGVDIPIDPDFRVIQLGEELPGECPVLSLGATFAKLARRTFSTASFDDKRFKFTPAYTVNASASYTVPVLDLGDLTLRASWYSRSRTYFDVANTPGLDQAKYGLLDARVTFVLPDGNTTLSLWGKNLLDRTYIDGVTNLQDSVGFDQVWYGWPRRYGVEISRRF